MKWKRVQAAKEERCSVRGCVIPPGTPHWQKTWHVKRSSPWIESVYCEPCARGARCDAGHLKLGPAVILALAAVCLVVLPAVWPGHLGAYLGLFVLSFAALAVCMSRLKFWRPWRKPSAARVTLSQLQRSAATGS